MFNIEVDIRILEFVSMTGKSILNIISPTMFFDSPFHEL